MKAKSILLLIFAVMSTSIYAQDMDYEVGDHNLLLMPTAYTMPRGKAYFSDYELFFLDFHYAPTSRSHIGAFVLFPVTTEFINTLTLQYKHNILRAQKVQSAFWGAFNPKTNFFTIGNVMSFGGKKSNLHIALNGLNVLDNSLDDHGWFLMYMAGFQTRLSKRTSFMAEYMNMGYTGDDLFVESSGIFSFGFRFRAKTMSWELGAIRPIDADDSELFLLPLLKATIMLN